MHLIDPNTAAFWHRRINEITMLVSGVTIMIWLVVVSSQGTLSELTTLGWVAVATAIISFVISCVCYIWVPQQHIRNSSLVAYFFLVVTSILAILATGGVESPVTALWLVVLLFAGLFSQVGLFCMTTVSAGFALYLSQGQSPAMNESLIYLVVFILPLIISYLLWHKQSHHEAEKDQAYTSLAAELSTANNRSDIIINAIADGVIAVDNRRIIQLINPAAERMLGWEKQDAVGLDLDTVLKLTDHHDQPLNDDAHVVHAAMITNSTQRSDRLTLTTRSGKKIIPSVMASPLGSFEGSIIVFRDITEEKQEERQQAEFISTASHEMRTPVASIEGYMGLALNPDTATIDNRARSYLIKAHESAQHLGRLFQDLLDVSKAEDGRMQNKPRVVDITAFTRDVVGGQEQSARAKGLILLFKPDTSIHNNDRLTPLYFAHVDLDHLREVLSNLIENAIKYTPQGSVVVDVTGDKDRIRVSVKDSGIGIPKEDLGHLFQKFYRVDNSDTREIGGTGLGLYLCRRLVETMNGRIWVESEFHKGSTFYVELPRLSNDEAQRIIETAADVAEHIPASPGPVKSTPAEAAPTPLPIPPPPQPTPSANAQSMLSPATIALEPVPYPPTVPPPTTPTEPLIQAPPQSPAVQAATSIPLTPPPQPSSSTPALPVVPSRPSVSPVAPQPSMPAPITPPRTAAPQPAPAVAPRPPATPLPPAQPAQAPTPPTQPIQSQIQSQATPRPNPSASPQISAPISPPQTPPPTLADLINNK